MLEHFLESVRKKYGGGRVKIMAPKKYTESDFRKAIADAIMDGSLEPETDNEGQLVFYTGMYETTEGVIQDEHDPEWSLNDSNGPPRPAG